MEKAKKETLESIKLIKNQVLKKQNKEKPTDKTYDNITQLLSKHLQKTKENITKTLKIKTINLILSRFITTPSTWDQNKLQTKTYSKEANFEKEQIHLREATTMTKRKLYKTTHEIKNDLRLEIQKVLRNSKQHKKTKT